MSHEDVKLGIAPINWCNDDMPELGADISLDQCLSEMQEAGYSGTELGNKFPTDPHILAPVLSRYGLLLTSAWHSTYFVDYKDDDKKLSNLKERLEFLSAMKARAINVAECSGTVHGDKNRPLSDRPVFTDQEWDHLVKGLETAGDLCNSLGIRAAYHHHMGTGIQTREEIDRLMESTDPDKVFLCADTGHMRYAGFDPLPLFEKYMRRIVHIHLKDLRETVLTEVLERNTSFLDSVLAGVFTVPGDGMIDFESIFDLIRDSGYRGWMIVEAQQDPSRASPLRYAKVARDYIREKANL